MTGTVTTIDFEGLTAGTVVDTQFDGVTIVAQRDRDGSIDNSSENDAMIFDTANPTGGDDDLATTDQGNVVIVSEDNDSSDPDDEAGGGSISFTFDDPADVEGLTIVDGDTGGRFLSYDADGNLISEIAFPAGPDGAVRTFELNVEGVTRLIVEFANSGGVDDLRYIPYTPPASIGGTVFMDNDDDAVESTGDMPLSGLTVVLLQNGIQIAETTTDSAGNYLFEGVTPGEGFSVQFPEVADKSFVDPNVGVDDTIDSDATEDEIGAISHTFDLTAGEDLRDVDAGLIVTDTGDAALSGRVFVDSDGDDQDNGEMGVPGVTVTLTNAAGDVIATTRTDAKGSYR
ncbi:MAG: SdrD B-like domain-containing protein, partial [Pseudomonadota bacterium]